MDDEFFWRAVYAGKFFAGEFAVGQEFGDVAQGDFRRAHGEFEAIDESIVFPLTGFYNRGGK